MVSMERSKYYYSRDSVGLQLFREPAQGTSFASSYRAPNVQLTCDKSSYCPPHGSQVDYIMVYATYGLLALRFFNTS